MKMGRESIVIIKAFIKCLISIKFAYHNLNLKMYIIFLYKTISKITGIC
jgi:hypothetical protein